MGHVAEALKDADRRVQLAAAQLLREAGAVVEQALFVIDLPDLGGAARLRAAGLEVSALLDFPGH